MAPKFGNYLFRNLQDQPAGGAGSTPEPREVPALADCVITLRENDFVLNEGSEPALAWDRHPGQTVEVHLQDICGLMEGRVTIQAGVLRKVAAALVPANLPDDLPLPLCLRNVVMQIQPYLESSSGSVPRAPGQDFDTPIAQVAREDEGFFKLEPGKESASGKGPLGAAEAPWPAVPLIREKPEAAPALPGTVVHVPRPALTSPEARPAEPPQRPNHPDPFGGLPVVGPPSRPPDPACPAGGRETGGSARAGQSSKNEGTTPAAPVLENPSGKPSRRVALERLQEVFMTEDLLDVGQVLRLIVETFPKVARALAVTEDGKVHGETAERVGEASLAQPSALLKATGEFARCFGLGETQGLTLLGNQPVSVIGDGRLCLIVFHQSRNLPPGMKDRLAVVAAALRDLLAVEPAPVQGPHAATGPAKPPVSA